MTTGSTSALTALDWAVDRFEAELRAGSHPRIEEFLSATQSLPREACDALLTSLLRAELDAKFAAGDPLRLQDYLDRFNDSRHIVLAAIEAWLNEAGRPPNEIASTPEKLVASIELAGARLHAKGGLGEVRAATDTRFGRQVAVKQIQPQFADRRDAQRRFCNEAEITGRLEHPGIVPVYGYGRDAEGRDFYAMRFVHGRSLRDAVLTLHSQQPILATPRAVDVDSPTATAVESTVDTTGSCEVPTPTKIEQSSAPRETAAATTPRSPFHDPAKQLELRGLLNRFIQVCDALAYAHSRGVIHRDVKPANIMLGNFGETLLVDWGLAKELNGADVASNEIDAGACILVPSLPLSPADDELDMERSGLTSTGQAVGTPAYMAPEQAAGAKDIDARCDVYGLGATLYFLLTARHPIESAGQPLFELLERARRGETPRPRTIDPAIPRALDAVCIKAMAPDRNDRYASASELARDLERCLADEPTTAFPESLPTRLRRWLRQRPRLAGGVAAGLLVGLCMLSVGMALLNDAFQKERAAKELADDNRQEADRQARLAAEKSAEARKTVDDWFTDVAENAELKETPNAHRIRERLLRRAGDYYAKRTELERSDDPEVRLEAARAYVRLGLITLDLDPGRKAQDFFRKSVALLDELAKRDPKDDRLATLKATALTGIADSLEANGRLAEAREQAEAALALERRLAADLPNDVDRRNRVANALNRLATIRSAAGDRAIAVTLLREATAIRRKLFDERPSDFQIAKDFSQDSHNLALRSHDAGDYPTAIAQFRQAVDLLDKLLKERPDDISIASAWALSMNGLGISQMCSGDAKGAKDSYDKAMRTQERLARENPLVVDYACRLAQTHNNLGVLMQNARNGKSSLESHQRATAIRERISREHPTVTGYMFDLAQSYNNLAIANDLCGNKDAAVANFKKALELQRRLWQSNPTILKYHVDYAGSLGNVGNSLKESGRFKEAVEHFGSAIDETAAALKRDPKFAAAIEIRRLAFWGRAETLDALGNFKGALADFDAAIALDDGRDGPELRKGRDALLAKLKSSAGKQASGKPD